MKTVILNLSLFFLLACAFSTYAQKPGKAMTSGKTVFTEKEVVGFATVYLKGTGHGGITNQEGIYHVSAPVGNYTLVVSAIGYKTVEKPVMLLRGQRVRQSITISPETQQLDEAMVVSTGVSRLRRPAFNAVAMDAKELQNTTKNLSDVLAEVPGMKLCESGGVGSDMQFILDGFSGRHVKVFIDSVPQEGTRSSFGLNNIPVNSADRIEVYKGVVPVRFGTDATGGAINIVASKKRRCWFLNVPYSYGLFNTHKFNANFGQALKNGFICEINVFQNYSDNDYHTEAPVEDFETGRTDRDKKVRVKRFSDTYHNEAIVGKVGVVDKKWADHLVLGFAYSNTYQDIQAGVRQDTAYDQKHRKGYSLIPSLEHYKRNLFAKRLDVALTINYNKNLTTNVDTTSYEYNWYGDRKLLNSPGEQSYQHSRIDNNNWNGTSTANYCPGKMHMLTFNHVPSTFSRSNTSLLAKEEQSDAIVKETRKNISGVSYRLMPSEIWNLSMFGKCYNQFVAGPVATDANQNDYVHTTHSVSSIGYGAAGTYFILPELQAKLSYEKAYRLPIIEETFGNKDLEMGGIGIRPKNSDNVNLNLSYNGTFGRHSVYVEGGLVYHDTENYIQRSITNPSGGKSAVTYINYGKMLMKGYNISAHYGFGKWADVGGNFTQMDVRDNMKTSISGSAENIVYKERMPNLPYIFVDSDVTFYWQDLGRKGNTLTVSYDNQYLHSFMYYSSKIGSSKGDYVVPSQFPHNLFLSYSLRGGCYNLSFECRNFTGEQLYDNFSLQKAGRTFHGEVRVYFGN